MIEFHSQSGQDKWVYETLIEPGTRPPGTFLDVGCSHPFEGNNSATLESLGWTGVLVDWNLGMIEECRRRRRSPAIAGDAWHVDWRVLCSDNHLPLKIDYLSLDLDDANGEPSKVLHVLKSMFYFGLSFELMTVEHDEYRLGVGTRNDIRALLEKDYRLVAGDVTDRGCAYEDWFQRR